MSILVFGLLSSVTPEGERTRQDELRNGIFSMVSFILGACTSILSGYVGMRIATYANARTALEARKGIAPAFMTGGLRHAADQQPEGFASFTCWLISWVELRIATLEVL